MVGLKNHDALVINMAQKPLVTIAGELAHSVNGFANQMDLHFGAKVVSLPQEMRFRGWAVKRGVGRGRVGIRLVAKSLGKFIDPFIVACGPTLVLVVGVWGAWK